MIAAEDHNFYEHNGVDVKGIARAFVANKQAGATQQGASTLTMQFVRHVDLLLGHDTAGGRRGHRRHRHAQAPRDALRSRSRRSSARTRSSSAT